MRGSHGLPPSLLGPIGKRFRRQTVPHLLTPEACPTRVRAVLRLVAPLAPFGHTWSFATHISDPTPEEMAQAAESMFAQS